jgi:cytochrome b
MMKTTALLTLATVTMITGTAHASSSYCNEPRSKWMSMDEARASVTKMGYKVRKMKVDDGCYEAYAIDDNGTPDGDLYQPRDRSHRQDEAGRLMEGHTLATTKPAANRCRQRYGSGTRSSGCFTGRWQDSSCSPSQPAMNGTSHMKLAGYAIAGLVAPAADLGVHRPAPCTLLGLCARAWRGHSFLRDTMQMRAPRYLGHNPAGGAMVIALLSAISVISLTGYMMTTDSFWGVEWVEEVHEVSVYATLGLIALHVLGVIVASSEHSENLVLAMFTGRKRR